MMGEWNRNFGRNMILLMPDHNKTHGMRYSAEYSTWRSIKKRCTVKSHPNFFRYGGRGITICPEWADDFMAFFAYVGKRPSPSHSIDRWPNADGNYEPGNVRWATKLEQSRHRPSFNLWVEFNGERKYLWEWAEISGVKLNTLHWRIFRAKWPVDRALSARVQSEKYSQRRKGVNILPV